jgi:hypothetical protein
MQSGRQPIGLSPRKAAQGTATLTNHAKLDIEKLWSSLGVPGGTGYASKAIYNTYSMQMDLA